MISPDRITGLIKFERYPDNIPVVQILGIDGHITFECGTMAEQEELLHTLSKQLERYLNPVDLIDLDLNIGNKIN
ncbi:MAG: hypothetical protein H6858_08980 [Rhodospirillales bacterium]|nr:hypothetical protein [Alphaproteobacteria bacterium]MCB1839449.1 hypothetical protein [Alphaproteobacteria bacterium]MCB9977717.1 hypothetical protein [Rhodospirillales bacterium]